jgi:Plasmid pRiA4b ORF-3-like protein
MPEPSAASVTIYQLRVALRGVSPLVWRRLLVASNTSLAELHEAVWAYNPKIGTATMH